MVGVHGCDNPLKLWFIDKCSVNFRHEWTGTVIISNNSHNIICSSINLFKFLSLEFVNKSTRSHPPASTTSRTAEKYFPRIKHKQTTQQNSSSSAATGLWPLFVARTRRRWNNMVIFEDIKLSTHSIHSLNLIESTAAGATHWSMQMIISIAQRQTWPSSNNTRNWLELCVTSWASICCRRL